MKCNICGNIVKICDTCGEELEGQFYCYDDGKEKGHFCSEKCWKEYLYTMYEGNLEIAEGDKDA